MPGDAAHLRPSQKRPSLKPAEIKWRTLSQQRIYRQKLLNAVKSTTASASSSASSPAPPSRAIKEAADSALALTAKGQSRWSRAILSSHRRKRRLCLLAAGKIVRSPAPHRPPPPPPPPPSPSPKKQGERVQERLRVLSRLVPGARKLPTPTLLEEAADYVAALEMQVKAMRALADLLSATSISSPS